MAAMGCTKEYNRDWETYNRALVRRGLALNELSWVSGYGSELARMNSRKSGRPYAYGRSLIRYVARLKASTGMPFRMLEGFIRPILEVSGISVPCYSTLWKRCSETKRDDASPDDRPRMAAADSTGIQVSVRGGWMREKWSVHKGWIKLHILSDVRTNEILSFRVTDELSGDAQHLVGMVDDAASRGYRIDKVLSDGAYDSKYNWTEMRRRDVRFVTNLRKNASGISRGCLVRSHAVRVRNQIGDDIWKAIHGYRMRWKVESAFSDYKRMFGESVSSKTFDNMVREIERNIECFNLMKRVTL
jgi:hypothetical protein